MGFQRVLNDILKERFTEIAGDCAFGGCESASQAPYYLADLQDNLVEPMDARHSAAYGGGSGNELDSKMKALRSSSALTFNTFGNGPAIFNAEGLLPQGTYKVSYEYQLPTLSHNPNPANLDARLVRDDDGCVAYFEFKMLEWLTSQPGRLRPAYFDLENYLIPRADAKLFAEVFLRLSDCAPLAAAGTDSPLKCRFSRYDAFQMTKHLLAIYTAVVQGKESHGKVILVNCVWDLIHPERLGEYEARYRRLRICEKEEYGEFAKATEPLCELFRNRGIDFQMGFITHQSLLNQMDISPDKREKLARYLI